MAQTMGAEEEAAASLQGRIQVENCNEIIPNLFLGGIAAARQTQLLADQGLCAVVCCVRELEFLTSDFHSGFEYYRVDVEDMSREPIELFWPEATEFIHSWLQQGKPVLVHCRAGVSRSGSTVLAYLVAQRGYSLHDAFRLVRNRRPVVTPNLGFMEKLSEFEATTRQAGSTIDLDKYASWYQGADMKAAIPNLLPGATAEASPTGVSPLARLRSATQRLKVLLWLSDHTTANEVDLDLPSTSSQDLQPEAKTRLSRVRQLLLRHAAQDGELGYCQGMHFAMVVFVASSGSLGEAYWRFHALSGRMRGLWLPGLPLVTEGLQQFAQAARGASWFEHLTAYGVGPEAYLPQAWLGFLAAWLPLSTLVHSLEFLECKGFPGLIAMSLAVLDSVAERLLQHTSIVDLKQVLSRLSEQPPDATQLVGAARCRLATVTATTGVMEGWDQWYAVEQLVCQRQGSRLCWKDGINAFWPDVVAWAMESMDGSVTPWSSHDEEGEQVAGTTSAPAPAECAQNT